MIERHGTSWLRLDFYYGKKTSFTALFADAPELRPLWPQLDYGRHLLTGLTGSAKTLLIEAAITRVGHPLLVVASDRNHAEELVADLGNVSRLLCCTSLPLMTY